MRVQTCSVCRDGVERVAVMFVTVVNGGSRMGRGAASASSPATPARSSSTQRSGLARGTWVLFHAMPAGPSVSQQGGRLVKRRLLVGVPQHN